MDRDRLIELLKKMDRQQQETDEMLGQREIAWYYCQGEIEEALGVPPGHLSTPPEQLFS